MERKLVKTGDGSHSLFVPELDEYYHSTHGALRESNHVFIDAGLHYTWASFPDQSLRLFEVGFGTGLNALLTGFEAEKTKEKIHYTSIESSPLPPHIIEKLNYSLHIPVKGVEKQFQNIHHSEWEVPVQISGFFELRKIKVSVEDFNSPEDFHLIFFDAFGPKVQPEMWHEEILQKMYSMLKPRGIFVTYCAKGEVKRTLKKIGFEVQSLPGPPGKREMTRAIKP